MRYAGCASSGEEDIHLLGWPKGKRGLELTGALHGSREESFFQAKKYHRERIMMR